MFPKETGQTYLLFLFFLKKDMRKLKICHDKLWNRHSGYYYFNACKLKALYENFEKPYRGLFICLVNKIAIHNRVDLPQSKRLGEPITPAYIQISYTAVRQSQILPFCFLQCICYFKPPCSLLILRDVATA